MTFFNQTLQEKNKYIKHKKNSISNVKSTSFSAGSFYHDNKQATPITYYSEKLQLWFSHLKQLDNLKMQYNTCFCLQSPILKKLLSTNHFEQRSPLFLSWDPHIYPLLLKDARESNQINSLRFFAQKNTLTLIAPSPIRHYRTRRETLEQRSASFNSSLNTNQVFSAETF